jgi:hypothetical protein
VLFVQGAVCTFCFFAFAQLAIGARRFLVDGEGEEGTLSAWADGERMESRAPADVTFAEGGG